MVLLARVVHGDDFAFTSLDGDLEFVVAVPQRHYEIKNRGRLGSGSKDVSEIDILGRLVRLHEWGLLGRPTAGTDR